MKNKVLVTIFLLIMFILIGGKEAYCDVDREFETNFTAGTANNNNNAFYRTTSYDVTNVEILYIKKANGGQTVNDCNVYSVEKHKYNDKSGYKFKYNGGASYVGEMLIVYIFCGWADGRTEVHVWKATITGSATAPTLSNASKTYDGSALAIGVSGGANGTIYYKTSSDNSNWSGWSTTKPTRTAAGTTYVRAYTKGNSGYTDSAETGSATITISKANSSNPTLSNKSKTYDGSALSIGVSGGSGGTIYYRTSENNSSWSGWGTTVPSRTAAGTTYVQAYVKGDGNHNDTSATGSATITITALQLNAPGLSNASKTYDGSALAIGVTSTDSRGTTYYRTSSNNSSWGSWTTTKPTRTDYGTTYVQGYTAGSGNYSNSGTTSSYTISISKANSTNPTLSNGGGTYSGSAYYIGVSGGSGGIIYYRTSTNNSSWGSWTTTKPSLTNVGTLYVQAYVKGDGNHNDTSATGSKTITVTALQLNAPGLSNASKTYDGSALAIGVSSTDSRGTTYYRTSDNNSSWGSWTTTKPTRTSAGTTYVQGYTAGSGNYSNSGTTSSYTITISKANSSNPTLSNKSKTYDGNALSIGVSGGSGGTIYYRTSENNSSWSGWGTAVPSRTAAGTTYVQAYVKGDGNHNDTSATGSATITINKASSSNPTLSNAGGPYTGSAYSIGVSGGSGGTIYYKTSENNSTWSGWSTTLPSRTNGGTTYVRAYVKGDGNHSDTSETGSATITVTPIANPMTFGTTETISVDFSTSDRTNNFTAAASAQGTVTYSVISQIESKNGAVSHFSIPTATTNGIKINGKTPVETYTVVVRATAAGNANYNSSTKDKTITINVLMPSNMADETSYGTVVYGTLPIDNTNAIFGGYYILYDGSGDQYLTNTGYLSNTADNRHFTYNGELYAKWSAGTITLPVLTKSGYTFKGWSEIENATDATYSPGATININTNRTLYAVWN